MNPITRDVTFFDSELPSTFLTHSLAMLLKLFALQSMSGRVRAGAEPQPPHTNHVISIAAQNLVTVDLFFLLYLKPNGAPRLARKSVRL